MAKFYEIAVAMKDGNTYKCAKVTKVRLKSYSRFWLGQPEGRTYRQTVESIVTKVLYDNNIHGHIKEITVSPTPKWLDDDTVPRTNPTVHEEFLDNLKAVRKARRKR